MLLLDEITVDMDVLGRMELLNFFTRECEVRWGMGQIVPAGQVKAQQGTGRQ
jgi:hypothetical protein